MQLPEVLSKVKLTGHPSPFKGAQIVASLLKDAVQECGCTGSRVGYIIINI
jgi:hypothetical protein